MERIADSLEGIRSNLADIKAEGIALKSAKVHKMERDYHSRKALQKGMAGFVRPLSAEELLSQIAKEVGVKDRRTVLAHCNKLGLGLVDASNNIQWLKDSIAKAAKRPNARRLAKGQKGQVKKL